MSIFREVKEHVTLMQAVEYLQLGPPKHRDGDEMRWACPACQSKDTRTLCVTLSKGFGCWVGASGKTPKHRGDMFALVAHVRGITPTEAAQELKAHFLGRSPGRSPLQGTSAPERSGSVPHGPAPLDQLTYLEPHHEVSSALGLTELVMRAIEGGYAPKGTMAGRILVPLRALDGTLLGNMGFATKVEQEPLLLLPPNLEDRCRQWIEAQAMKQIEQPPELPKQPPDTLRKLFRLVRGS